MLLLTVGLLGVGMAWGQSADLITFTDLYKVRQLGSVTVSDDGRYVAYVVRSIVEDGDDRAYRSQIWVVAAHVIETPRQLTFAASGASSPNWHPNSDRLAFVRHVDGKPQIFEISIYGGEARQLTDHEHGASSPQWSPTGDKLLFTSTLTTRELSELTDLDPSWSHERPKRSESGDSSAEPDPDGTIREMRAYLDSNARESNPRVFTRLDLQGELDLQPELS